MAKRALGKGLGALMPTASEAFLEEEAGLVLIPLKKIRANAYQPRQDFQEKALKELAVSIKEKGLIQPVVVVKREDMYELVSGERRTRAAKMAGLKEIPALVRDYDHKDQAEIALIENIQRENLNVIEEGLAYQSLLKEFSLTQAALSDRIGKSRAHIANTVRLLDLSQQAKAFLADGRISAGHARALLTLPPDRQLALCQAVVQEGWSVRALEKEVKRDAKPTRPAPSGPEELPADIEAFREQLEEKFASRVRIRYGEDKGSIQIDYFTAEDLLRIADLLLE